MLPNLAELGKKYTLTLKNVFLFHHAKKKDFFSPSHRIGAKAAIFLSFKEKATKKKLPFFQHHLLLIQKGFLPVFILLRCFMVGEKMVFFDQTLPLLPLSLGIAVFPSGNLRNSRSY